MPTLSMKFGLGTSWLLLAVVLVSCRALNDGREVGAANSGSLQIIGGQWLDVESGKLRANTGITVQEGWITSVEDPSAATGDIDHVLRISEDWTVLPGLIDLHAHYAVDLFGEGRIDETVAYPALFLANGVTTTFPAGEIDANRMRDLRKAIDAGERVGPRVLNSGPYFGSARNGWDAAAMTPDSIFAEVDHWAGLGVRGFKAKGIGSEHLKPLIDRAHKHGLTVTGHLDSGFRGSVNPRDAIRIGIDRIEHFLGGDMMPADRSAYASLQEFDDFNGEALRDIIDLYVEAEVRFDATLSIYGYWGPHDREMTEYWTDELRFLTPYMRTLIEMRPSRPVVESFARMSPIKRQTAKAFYDGGGRDLITLGTDHPSWGRYWSGFGTHRELLALSRAGIPAADVFRIGTLNGARAMGLGDELGSIKVGKLADLVIVRGDPLLDVRVARDVEYVIIRGVLHSAAELFASVEGTIGPQNEADESAWRPER